MPSFQKKLSLMWFRDENLHTLQALLKVCHTKKNQNFLLLFLILLFTTGAFELEIRRILSLQQFASHFSFEGTTIYFSRGVRVANSPVYMRLREDVINTGDFLVIGAT